MNGTSSSTCIRDYRCSEEEEAVSEEPSREELLRANILVMVRDKYNTHGEAS
jgi:hypothetical protein